MSTRNVAEIIITFCVDRYILDHIDEKCNNVRKTKPIRIWAATHNATQLLKHIVKPLVVLVILMLYYQRPSQQFLCHDEKEPPCFCFVLGG